MLEKAMVDHVVQRGWLSGTLRRAEKAAAEKDAAKLARIEERLERWHRKAMRAKKAIVKLEKTRAYYIQKGR